MSNTKTRKGRYTPERQAAAAARDAELRERAGAALADEAKVRAFAAAAVAMSPRLLRYSLRNQMLLAEQTEERGMPLVDVATFRGWLQLGRAVRKGEKALMICAYRGADATEPDADQVERAGEADTDQEASITRRFRMMPVFEISQTDGVEDVEYTGTCGGCNAAADEPCHGHCRCTGCVETDPEQLLTDSLTAQITRAGYAVTIGGPAGVDHNARTVTAPAPADLAVALADIITTTSRERHEIPAQRASNLDIQSSLC